MKNLSLKELNLGLSSKKFSSEELTKFFLNEIKTSNPKINAFITVDEDKSLQQARDADKRISQDNMNELTGIPIAQKDIFCAKGWKTTCGSKMLDNFYSPYDSKVIELFNQSGAVNLGKTNMDEFAMGSSNETSYYGPVRNPWDTERVPGGSSGGSAAAVAARLCVAATGTDTGGSIRQPAALTGITGLKPTYGRCSRWGMIAFASSLDQAGTMTQTAEDSALLLAGMAGFDSKDSTSAERPVDDYAGALQQDIKGLKVGLVKEFMDEGLNAEMGAAVQQAIEQLKALGAEIVEVSLPNAKLSVPAYYVVAPAECSSNLSRFDGVRFGHRCKDPKDLEDLYKRSRSEGFGDEVKRRIMIGTYALSAGYYDAYYLKAQQVRQLIAEDFRKAFAQVDMIASPTSPDTAFKLGEKADDPISMYLSDIYTIAVNLAGLPAISIPAPMVNNLPTGLQLIGNVFQESRLLNVAHQLQLATDWHQQKPDAFI
jgi:aspartyl-tRNA(Asn)/glutamyl-tRNA(Gln) amidotransferase subunit A